VIEAVLNKIEFIELSIYQRILKMHSRFPVKYLAAQLF